MTLCRGLKRHHYDRFKYLKLIYVCLPPWDTTVPFKTEYLSVIITKISEIFQNSDFRPLYIVDWAADDGQWFVSTPAYPTQLCIYPPCPPSVEEG